MGLHAKWTILVVGILLNVESVANAVSEAACPAADHSARFGPIRDQDGHGYCWAFTAAALLEEQACIQDAKLCKKNLSPIDASGCSYQLYNTKVSEGGASKRDEGGDPMAALRCSLDRGICSEEDAPYFVNAKLSASVCGKAEGQALTQEQLDECLQHRLVQIFEEFKKIRPQNLCALAGSCRADRVVDALSESTRKTLEESIQTLQSILPTDSVDKTGLTYGFLYSSSAKDFSKQIRIPQKCTMNRHRFLPEKSLEARLVDFFESKLENKKDQIKKAIQKKSVGLGVCIANGSKLVPCKNKKGVNHALVVNGLRWNKEKNKCEISVRNSWGEDSPVHGWMDFDVIAEAAGEMYQIHPKSDKGEKR